MFDDEKTKTMEYFSFRKRIAAFCLAINLADYAIFKFFRPILSAGIFRDSFPSFLFPAAVYYTVFILTPEEPAIKMRSKIFLSFLLTICIFGETVSPMLKKSAVFDLSDCFATAVGWCALVLFEYLRAE